MSRSENKNKNRRAPRLLQTTVEEPGATGVDHGNCFTKTLNNNNGNISASIHPGCQNK